jgi:hypothetical protein
MPEKCNTKYRSVSNYVAFSLCVPIAIGICAAVYFEYFVVTFRLAQCDAQGYTLRSWRLCETQRQAQYDKKIPTPSPLRGRGLIRVIRGEKTR